MNRTLINTDKTDFHRFFFHEVMDTQMFLEVPFRKDKLKLLIDGREYEFPLASFSQKLASADEHQKNSFKVSSAFAFRFGGREGCDRTGFGASPRFIPLILPVVKFVDQ